MRNDYLDFAYQVITDLGLENFVPVGDSSADRYDHVSSVFRTAIARREAKARDCLAMIPDENKADRREFLQLHMDVGDIVVGRMNRGYRVCQMLDAQEHHYWMLELEQERIKERTRSKVRYLASTRLESKAKVMTEKLRMQLAVSQSEQQGGQ